MLVQSVYLNLMRLIHLCESLVNEDLIPGVMPLNLPEDHLYETWANRRLHTLDIWLNNEKFSKEANKDSELAPDVRTLGSHTFYSKCRSFRVMCVICVT